MSQSEYMKEAERLLDEVYRFKWAEGVHDIDGAFQSADTCGNGANKARAALLAHIQRGVPGGYDIAPAFRGYAKLGSGHYVLHNCPRTDEDHPSLVIAIATEAEKSGRQIGELGQSQPGLMIQPERIAVRIDFKSVAALDALEQQLRFLREDSFPDSLTKVPAVPALAEVPMPQSYVERPTDYTGGVWIESQMRTYGDACRAAGEAAGCAQLLKWAVSSWKSEVENRPLENKNRRPLDDVWRQVVRFAGGDPDALLGPSHDAALRREVKQ